MSHFEEETTISVIERWDGLIGAWVYIADVDEGTDPEALVKELRLQYDDDYAAFDVHYRLVTTTRKPL